MAKSQESDNAGAAQSHLLRVMARLQKEEPHDYKYDCFQGYVKSTDPGAQAARTRILSVFYYAQALANAPAGWKETIDVR